MDKKLEDWQERVIEEKAALDEKMEKLRVFMEADKFEDELEGYDKFLLYNQYFYMTSYSAVLGKRIERFKD